MPIRRLPALLVNQIAAGEVIERPASVVKELVENAIDAKATRIDIEIEDGGRELIRVSDDGVGIPPGELELAVAPHATSKIERQEDLDAIATMGFRGEALASIASVSRLSLLSRPRSEASGALIEAEGDAVGAVKPAAASVGTVVTVRNLFFNTPARRKFLKTDVTEASRIAEMIESIALAHPRIAFTLRSKGRDVIDLASTDSPKRRALDVLGRELDGQMLEVSADDTADRGLSLWGLIGRPEIARANATHQRLYLNGRPIRDRALQHALREAYRGLIEPGRYPTLLLFIEMDPRQVDVNVHPTKAEVRFRNQQAVHGSVLHAVRRRLREADLTPSIDLSRAAMPDSAAAGLLRSFPPAEFGRGAAISGGAMPLREVPPHADPARAFVQFFHRLDPKQKGFVYGEVRDALAREDAGFALEAPSAASSTDAPTEAGRIAPAAPSSLPVAERAAEILQVHSSYIVTQDEQGIVIIDQHALHERVMFEKLIARLAQGDLESQRMLMPEVVEVDRGALARLDDLRPLLARLGIDAEMIGPDSLAVHAFPSFLFERHVEVGPFMKELLERAAEGALGDSPEAALSEVLDMMACKAAVKAGDHLSPDELRELLRYRDTVERSSNCPHGRPTTLRLSISDLDRQFGRT
jgi:DNA mismatch repair protein MutL